LAFYFCHLETTGYEQDSGDKTANTREGSHKGGYHMEGNVMERNNLSGIPTAVLMQGNLAKTRQKEFAEGKPEDIQDPEKKEIIDRPESDDTDDLDIEAILAEDEPVKEPDKPTETKKPDEQRESVLQGMFDKHKREAQAREDELLGEIKSLRKVIDNLNMIIERGAFKASQEEDDPGASTQKGKVNRLDPEKFTDYGDEIVDIANMVNSLVDENEKLRADQVSTSSKLEEDSNNIRLRDFKSDMSRLVNPAWEQINLDPLFKNWLLENPDLNDDIFHYGMNLDAVRAARIFNLFIKTTGYKVPTPLSKPRMEDEILPDLSGTGEEKIETKDTPIVTRTQYATACKKMALGKITKKQFDKIQKYFNETVRKGLA